MAIPKGAIVILGALVVLAALLPPHILLVSEFLLVFFPEWSVGGVRLDFTDVTLGLVLLSLLLRGIPRPYSSGRRIPYMKSWFALTLLMSASYITADINQRSLTSLPRIVYQVYRYCLKELLYFPLGAKLFSELKTARAAARAIILAGMLISIFATMRGYAGYSTFGPFVSGNGLGASLLAPLIFSYVGLVMPSSRRDEVLSIITILLIGRALLFTGSRGAFASALAAVLFGSFWLWISRPEVRARMLRLLPVAVLALAVLFALKPDVLERPTVKQAFSAFQGTKAGTMQWRIQERWPHFWSRTLEKPWLGFATPVDESLGKAGNTPHNGFLALAVSFGIPAALLFVLFGLRAIRDGLLIWRWSDDADYAILGLAVASIVVGLMVNSILESTIMMLFIGKIFWLLSGIVGVGAQSLRLGEAAASDSVESESDVDSARMTQPTPSAR